MKGMSIASMICSAAIAASAASLTLLSKMRKSSPPILATVLWSPAHLFSRCDLFQHNVSEGVAKRIIDGLELIQIEKKQGNLLVSAAGASQSVVQPVLQKSAMRQFCQSVIVGQEVDTLF